MIVIIFLVIACIAAFNGAWAIMAGFLLAAFILELVSSMID